MLDKQVSPFGFWMVVVGVLLMGIPLLVEGLWIYEFDRHAEQSERVAAYLAHFPGFAKDPLVRKGIAIGGGLGSGLAFYLGSVLSGGTTRWLAIVGLVLAIILTGLLTLLYIFQAM